MKVVVTCQPAVGHFHPLVPLARALLEAGHEVLFPTSASFRPTVEAAGFATVAAGLDWLESEPERAFPELADRQETWDAPDFFVTAFGRAAQALAPDLVRLIRASRCDLVVSESIEWAGPLAAEATRVPYAVLGIDALLPRSLVAANLGPAWRTARLGLGLPDDPALERYCPYLYLDAFPPSLHPEAEHGLSSAVVGVRPVPFEVGETSPPEWLAALPPRPSVYLTMGTIVNRVEGAFTAVLGALAEEDVNAVVTVGSTRDPASLGEQPAHIRVERYIRQSHVLPHADLVVAHGGYGTMIGALTYSLPMLSLPLGRDQRYNALAVERFGAGLRLDPRSASPEQVRTAIRELLTEPSYRKNAARLRAEIDELPPVESAIPLLERLAAEHRLPRRGMPVRAPAP